MDKDKEAIGIFTDATSHNLLHLACLNSLIKRIICSSDNIGKSDIVMPYLIIQLA